MTYSWTNRLHTTEERITRSVGIESGDVASALELDIWVNIRLTLKAVYASFLWTSGLKADTVVGVQPPVCWRIAPRLLDCRLLTTFGLLEASWGNDCSASSTERVTS